MRLVALALAGLALAGCETTAEKSARLEREAKRHAAHARAQTGVLQGLAAGSGGTRVRDAGTALVHSSEGTAAVVTLRNTTAHELREVPVLISVENAAGQPLYTNNSPGLSRTLTGVALLAPHELLSWIDDQVQASGTPAKVQAKIGDGTVASGAPAAGNSVTGALTESSTNGGTVEGTVTSNSPEVQHEVVVYATARRDGRIVSAGRGVLSEVPPAGSAHYELFLIGDPAGARLALSAPPTD